MIPIANPLIGEEEIAAAARVLRSGRLAQGPEVEAFEQEFAEYIGVDHAIAVSNGTVALQFAMTAAGFAAQENRLGQHPVHTTAFSFVSSATSIRAIRSPIRFEDIELDTYNMRPLHFNDVEDGDAALVVHLYGHPAYIPQVRGLPFVEDCAQSIGSKYRGRMVGSFGEAGAFSLYATKNITSGGEGGMVTTNHQHVADAVRLYRNHGSVGRYQHAFPGTNARITEVQAAVGRVQLQNIDLFNALRRSNAHYYSEHIDQSWLTLPLETDDCHHTYHQYVVRVGENAPVTRQQFIMTLADAGIECAIHYPTIIPAQRIFGVYDLSKYQNALLAARTVVSIPVGPWVTDADREHIVEVINGITE